MGAADEKRILMEGFTIRKGTRKFALSMVRFADRH